MKKINRCDPFYPFYKNTVTIPAPHLIFILFLSLIVINTFFTSQKNDLLFGLKDYFKAVLFIFLCVSLIIVEWAVIAHCFKQAEKDNFFYATIVLSPIALLFFWDPEAAHMSFVFPVAVILLTQYCFWSILSNNKAFLALGRNKKKIIFIFSVLYVIFFVGIGIRQYNFFSNFNPKDFAIYNQTFWNTIHGRIFQNSAYGTNFSCHNSPFFFLLVPFYYLAPHPLSLMVIKTILLVFSVIPFYLIIRQVISEEQAILPLLSAFLLYPHFISQNFTAPHEISYALFFVLFTYYFYQRRSFWLFFMFLSISLSIKEHIALIAIMFGFYSLWERRSKRWVILPITLGLAWGGFSLLLINYFQSAYNSHIDASWFIVDLKRRFSQNEGGFFHIVISTMSSSLVSGQWYGLKHIFQFFACLGVFLPLLSPQALLGVPELALALLSNRPVMLCVPWHYTIIFSCFLFIGAVYGIRKISRLRRIKELPLSSKTTQTLLSVIVFSATLMHAYTWIDLTGVKKTMDYSRVVKKALAGVPPNAFITVPREVAPFVSSREKYNILEGIPQDYGEYILIDKNTVIGQALMQKSFNGYIKVFDNSGVILLKRKGI